MTTTPDTYRDVVVTLPDGRTAYAYFSTAYRVWCVYPNAYPVRSFLELNPLRCDEGITPVSWREIDPVTDYRQPVTA